MSKQEILNEYATYCFDMKHYNRAPINFEKFCEWLKKTLDKFKLEY